MMSRMELAARLKYFREKAGLTIYDVGERIGKSGKTVSAWECGRGQPDADMLLTLCSVYGIRSIAELYGEPDGNSDALSAHEREMVDAYRAHPEMQAAVDKLLGVEPEERADESAELVEAFVSAAAKKSTPSG